MGVLDGVRVVELAEFGFVPSAAAVLADWGADVVKIERPTGDPLRMVQRAGLVADTGEFNFLWELYNRNKRGLALDLRNDDARPVFEQLIAGADVFLTSFLPTARERLRVRAEDLFTINPRLVYAKGHGQGQKGPDADSPGFDSISFWARGGLGHLMSPPGGPLVMQRAAMGDGPGGAMLAGAIAAALFQRERTGEGVVVDTSLLATAVWTLAPDLTSTTILDREPEHLNMDRALPNPLVGPYRTADGRWLILNNMDDTRHWAPVCRALRLDALIDDPRFVDTAARAEHCDELHKLLVEQLAAAPLADWKPRLDAEDTVWSVMASPLEVVHDAQVEANGYLAPHPGHDRARLPSYPAQFDDVPHEIRRGAPETGEHTDEILAELGVGVAEIERLRVVGAVA